MQPSLIILAYMYASDEFLRRVVVHLKPEYFDVPSEREAFIVIRDHFLEFNVPPSAPEALVSVSQKPLAQKIHDEACELIEALFEEDCSAMSFENLWQMAEKFAQDQELAAAIYKCIEIQKGEEKSLTTTAIPQLLQEALAVAFDTSIGHDYWEDYDARHAFYTQEDARTPFDIDVLNRATNGGIPKKTLNMVLSGTNVGKTLVQCHLASAYIAQGLDVLYVSLEESPEAISQRIDANVLDYDINEFDELRYEDYEKRIIAAKKRLKGAGKLVVKQYPPTSISAHSISNLLDELKIKKDFTPDIIFVDYIGCMSSMRVRNNGSVNTNTYYRFVAEELRGLAISRDCIVWSAQQLNRGGFASNDPDLDDIAEAFSIAQTADFAFSLTVSDELMELGQYAAKILKSRYSKKQDLVRFKIGVDYDRMRLDDVPDYHGHTPPEDNKKQEDDDNVPVFDRGRRNFKDVQGINF